MQWRSTSCSARSSASAPQLFSPTIPTATSRKSTARPICWAEQRRDSVHRRICMRIGVVGTGGIGGPYGASLARAGADVTFVARGAHLAAVRENGLRIEGDRGETHIRPAQATDDIASIGIVDYVLLCVKLWDVETAGEQIRPIVGPQTAVVPLQNGIDAADRLIPILGPEPVM